MLAEAKQRRCSTDWRWNDDELWHARFAAMDLFVVIAWSDTSNEAISVY